MSHKLLKQIKQRRKTLKLTQQNMQARIGISRQQYQYLESKGNPRLDTLELVAAGLESEILLIPKEKLNLIKTLLNNEHKEKTKTKLDKHDEYNELIDNPWRGLLDTKDSNK